MELYLLKSAACLAIFFAFYKLVLENTTIHNFKRFYLFGSLLTAFLIPYITFTTYVEPSTYNPVFTEGNAQITNSGTELVTNYTPIILWILYGLGVLFFSFKFFRNLFGLIQKIRQNPKYRNGSFINILLSETVIPHTFFNYIFLNKQQFENREIPREVMFHEEAHARQKHSLDIVFVEILQIVFWFNPLLLLVKRSIKLNHEFLADQAVLNTGTKTSEYQKIVLAFSSPDSYREPITPQLAHSINYSSIKKRFTVMKTHTSKRAIWLKSLLLLPLLAILIYGFSTKETVEREVQKTKEPIALIQQKATKAEIAEYNKLAKRYNAMPQDNMVVKKKDLERLHYLYGLMSLEQKKAAEPYPNIPPPPPPPPPHAQKVKKGEKSNIPPPPPPAPTTQIKYNQIDNSQPILTPAKTEPTRMNNSTKTLSAENGNLYMVPQPPPPPNPDLVEYIKELAKKGATFYIGPHKYSADEATEMVRKNKNASIDVSDYPMVKLDGC